MGRGSRQVLRVFHPGNGPPRKSGSGVASESKPSLLEIDCGSPPGVLDGRSSRDVSWFDHSGGYWPEYAGLGDESSNFDAHSDPFDRVLELSQFYRD